MFLSDSPLVTFPITKNAENIHIDAKIKIPWNPKISIINPVTGGAAIDAAWEKV